MKEITISLSKKKIILLFFGTFAFVILSFWSAQTAEIQTQYDPMFVKIISVAGIIFFGFNGVYTFVKFFDKKPGLVINDKGIIDNSSAVNAGLIKWENIINISIIKMALDHQKL